MTATTASPKFFLQAPDGRCIYIVPTSSDEKIEGMIRYEYLNGVGYASVMTDHPVYRLISRSTKRTYHSDYKLVDIDMVSKSFPMLVSQEQFLALGESHQDMYSQMFTTAEQHTVIYVSDYKPILQDTLQTEPVPGNWSVGAWSNFYGPVGAHLLPGTLSGFRKAALLLCKTFGTCVDGITGTRDLTVRVVSYWNPPLEGKKTQQWTTTTVEVPVSDTIEGNNLAEAQTKWAEALLAIDHQLRQYTGTEVCSHCGGNGRVVAPGKESK